MKKWYFLILCCFLILQFSKSTQVIVLDAQIQSTNKQEYLTNSNNLIEAAKHKGTRFYWWRPEYKNEFQVMKMLLSLQSKPKKNYQQCLNE